MKCRYCGKNCSASYCDDECSTKAELYEKRVKKVSVPRFVILILVDIVASVIVMIFNPPIGVGIMCLGFGLITLKYPYVTEETLTLVSIRSSLIMMRIISTVFIIGGIIAIGRTLLV